MEAKNTSINEVGAGCYHDGSCKKANISAEFIFHGFIEQFTYTDGSYRGK